MSAQHPSPTGSITTTYLPCPACYAPAQQVCKSDCPDLMALSAYEPIDEDEHEEDHEVYNEDLDFDNDLDPTIQEEHQP